MTDLQARAEAAANAALNTPFLDGSSPSIRSWMVQAALHALQSEGWRPISEAPKDGTAILLGYFRKNLDGSIYQAGGQPIVGMWLSGNWTTPYQKLRASGPFSPTHFRALPAPPEGEGV